MPNDRPWHEIPCDYCGGLRLIFNEDYEFETCDECRGIGYHEVECPDHCLDHCPCEWCSYNG